MAGRTPPRFVPTLTEVVRSRETPAGPAAPEGVSAAPLDEEELVRRVMKRVDAVLERRLRETIAATVIEQTRSLGPALRDQVEALVREAVSQALADESGPDPHQRR